MAEKNTAIWKGQIVWVVTQTSTDPRSKKTLCIPDFTITQGGLIR